MKRDKFLRILFLYIFIPAVVFSFSGSSALAAPYSREKNKVETRTLLEEATVNIYCRLKAGKVIYSPTGSGVFISDRGVILTNAHVAEYFLLAKEKGRVTGWCNVRTGSPAEETYTAEILYLPPVWLNQNIASISKSKPKGTGEADFALLHVTGVSKKKGKLPQTFPAIPLNLLATVPEGEKITISGYPTGKLNFKQIRQKLNSVTASSSVSNIRSFFNNNGLTDVLTLAPSAAAGFGVSGGPVVNEAGELVGIVFSKGSSEDNLTLRAITLSYIERTLIAHTGLNLATLINSDIRLTAQNLRGLITAEMVHELTKGFRERSR